jgi:hypothetical protein
MRIKLKSKINPKKTPVSAYDLQGEYIGQTELTVYAVRRDYGILSYLVFLDEIPIPGRTNAVCWVDSKSFIVTDQQRPKEWIERSWSFFHPYRMKKKNRDFDFRLTYYCGPEKLLNSKKFFFNVIENPKKASQFLMNTYNRGKNVSFQRSHNLKVDGEAGPATWEKLVE